MNNIKGVGIDMVDVARFDKFSPEAEDAFLKKVFFDSELKYCFSYKEPATHLAGIFAAKEAVSKCMGIKLFPFSEIEIIHDNDGKPGVNFKGKIVDVHVSITHTSSVAAAIAVR